jgi:N-methylhydantoinase B
MIDRTQFAAQGFAGGGPGALGLFEADGDPLKPKTVIGLEPGQRVLMAPPGGAGFGDPFQRPVDAVLADLVSGYVSLESAERDYGVVIRYVGLPDQLVRLREHYAVDEKETARLRRNRSDEGLR